MYELYCYEHRSLYVQDAYKRTGAHHSASFSDMLATVVFKVLRDLETWIESVRSTVRFETCMPTSYLQIC